MKILQVLPFLSPARGGSVIAPSLLSRQLSQRGHRVTIVTTDFEFDQEYAESLGSLGVEVIPFHCVANLKLFLVSPSIKKWLHNNVRHFDVIHMHNFRSYQNSAIHGYTKKHSVPYVLQARGSLPKLWNKQLLKKLYDVVWGYKLLRDASKVIALTTAEAEQYRAMGVDEKRISVVPNGINLSEFENLPQRGEFRARHSLSGSQKIVLFLGRIDRIKGLDLLMEAFADLCDERNDTTLVVAGPDGGHLEVVKEVIRRLGIEQKVVLPGPLYGRDKLEAYADSDVFVLPSSYEVFGTTVLEACACGTPVIVSNRCGIASVVDGQAGLVVPYDKDDLGNAILRVLRDGRMRKEFGNRGKSLVRERFGWSRIAEEIEGVYNRVLEEGIQGEAL